MTEPTDLLDTTPTGSALHRLATHLGCTEGQLYTMVIGAVLALGLAGLGIPPTQRAQAVSAAPTPSVPPAVPTAPLGQPPVVVPSAAPPVLGPPQPLPLPSPSAPVVPGPVATDPPPVEPPLPPGTMTAFARVGEPGAPSGIAVTTAGDVVVTTNNGTARGSARPSVVLVYGPGGVLRRTVAVPGQPAQHADGLVAAAADSTGGAYLLDAATSRVLHLARGASQLTVRARVRDVPLCLLTPGTTDCEQGVQDRAPSVAGLAVDARGTLYLTDAGQGIVWRLRQRDPSPQVWYTAADLVTGDGPAGIDLDRQGRVLFTAGSTLDVANPRAGGLYRLAVAADGTAGERTLVHAFAEGDRPGALTLGASGASYLVLRGSSAVVSLDREGTETGRITPPGRGPIRLDTPSGLALTTGRLLITNQATTNRSHWAVLAVVVNDAP